MQHTCGDAQEAGHFAQSAEVHCPPHQSDPQHTLTPIGVGDGHDTEASASGVASVPGGPASLGESVTCPPPASLTTNVMSGTPQPAAAAIAEASSMATSNRRKETIEAGVCHATTLWSRRVGARLATHRTKARGTPSGLDVSSGSAGQRSCHLIGGVTIRSDR
jgi:hypothetical protein